MFPDAGAGNPYIRLLRTALEGHGVEFVSDHQNILSMDWLRRHAGEGIVLHVHWPSEFYTQQRRPYVSRVVRLFGKLYWAQSHGYRISWTCHNLYPHEADQGMWLHWTVRQALCRLADTIFAHSNASLADLDRAFACRDKCTVVPHGHFIGAHGVPPMRGTARHRLGILEDEFLYCSLGKLRRYKGVASLIEEFAQIAQSRDRLHIAGVAEADCDNVLRKLSSACPSITYKNGWLNDSDLTCYLAAADAIVFPFTRILNSGSVILAMSHGALCVVPRTGSLPEILPEDAAVYYDCTDPRGLHRALQQVRRLSGEEMERRRRRAFKAAERLSWREAAEGMSCAWFGDQRFAGKTAA
jgi:glycosyltransferase involved in cell wall biosynthesis